MFPNDPSSVACSGSLEDGRSQLAGSTLPESEQRKRPRLERRETTSNRFVQASDRFTAMSYLDDPMEGFADVEPLRVTIACN